MAKNEDQLSKWSFLLGCILSLIVGFVSIPYSWSILIILGLIVGFMGVGGKETGGYLLSVVALTVIGSAWLNNAQVLAPVSKQLQMILASFTTFVGVAGVIVAIKNLWMMGRQ